MRIKTFLLLLIITLPAGWWLFGTGYYIMHDDLQVMRIFEMEKCLADWQIPCRWAPDMAYGYGQAMFNFYSAFPYYLGVLIRILTPLSIIATVKFDFYLSLLTSAVGMYLLARKFWGELGGIFASMLYTFAPYHAVDIYVRGALAEAWAIALLPFLWLSLYNLIKKPNFRNSSVFSLVFAFLLTTHNISTLIYAPFSLLWVIYWLVRLRNLKSLYYLGVSGFLGLGLAAFFLLPAIYEQKYIQIEHLTEEYSDFHAHFVSLKQLFLDRSWGDGGSIWGTNDGMSFQIGWPHWWILIFVVLGTVFFYARKKDVQNSLFIITLCGLALFTAFLAHSKSIFLWEGLPLMAFVQFPWRFLGLTIFFISFAAGSFTWLPFPYRKFLVYLFLFLALALNFSYFKPVHFSRLVKDEEKLSGIAFELQQKSAISDYLPKTAEIVPPAPAPSNPNVLENKGMVSGYVVRSGSFRFEAEMQEAGDVVIPVMYFPGWSAWVDSTEVPIEIHGAHGLIKVRVDEGKHVVTGRFTNTPIRIFANILTVVSALILFSWYFLSKKSKKKK